MHQISISGSDCARLVETCGSVGSARWPSATWPRRLAVAVILFCHLLSAQGNQAQELDTSRQFSYNNKRLSNYSNCPTTKLVDDDGGGDQRQTVGETQRALEELLPELTSSHNPNDEVQLQAVEQFLDHRDELQNNYSVSDVGFMALVARAHSMVYGDLYTHNYDSHEDMKQAAGLSVNNELCVRQLEQLVERTRRQEVEKYHSRDLNIYDIFDTWGRVPDGLLLGNVFFEGQYDECLRLKIQMGHDGDERNEVATRYCALIVKHVDWPQIDRHDLFTLKAGICIPKSCDSRNYKNKFELIMQLANYQYRKLEMDQVRFNGLYCLPDEDSPMRSIWNNPKSLLTLVCLSAWISVLLFATWKHNKLLSKRELALREETVARRNSGFGLTTNMQVEENDDDDDESVPSKTPDGETAPRRPTTGSYAKFYEVLSITNNLRLLFDTSKESSLMDTGKRLKSASSSSGRDENSSDKNKRGHEFEAVPQEGTSSKKWVDLRYIEGIKVVAMVYVIMGHVLMCLTSLMSNAKEFAFGGSAAFLIANLVPAFAVNAFFTITGMLTTYLMFKQNQSYSFITNPGKWFAFILYRYLRIMPMYALAVLYCKHLARFAGSGPLWDYATSSLAQRRICEQEPWFWTLTFTSNFQAPLRHCIPGGWYLSNDFQFFLATPLLLTALQKAPRLGRRLLYWGVIAGYLAGFLSILSSEIDNLKPIANFAPHGFKTYVSHFSSNYTQPQYRIPAYLIGLLIGHTLYQYEQERSRRAANGDREEVWSLRFRKRAPLLCLILVFVCCVTPLFGSKLTFSKRGARIMVALITPTYHVFFATAVGLYLLLATTGYGSERLNKLLALRQWKPLARLSLCAVLVNVETINYIIQGYTHKHAVTNQLHMAINCVCILATYSVALVACVLFEAPIRGALNVLLTVAITRVAANKKTRSGCGGGVKGSEVVLKEKSV